MPWSSSEPRFEPDFSQTGPKSGPKFRLWPELDQWFGPRFSQLQILLNCSERVRTLNQMCVSLSTFLQLHVASSCLQCLPQAPSTPTLPPSSSQCTNSPLHPAPQVPCNGSPHHRDLQLTTIHVIRQLAHKPRIQ